MRLARYPSVFVPLIVIACGSSGTKSTDVPPPVVKSSSEDVRGTCVAVFERQRECTSAFIPALVDLRVRLDVPSGIAETDRTGGRDALVAQAMEEWSHDSTDEAIARTCEKMPADEAMRAKAQECLKKDGCAPFVDCVIPLLQSHLAPGSTASRPSQAAFAQR
jgi:hypothetical protein